MVPPTRIRLKTTGIGVESKIRSSKNALRKTMKTTRARERSQDFDPTTSFFAVDRPFTFSKHHFDCAGVTVDLTISKHERL
jgi:hypothetical protein